MNKTRLRELFASAKGDVDDYYDAQRDLVEAQRRLLNRVFDIVEELAPPNDGVLAKADGGVTVMRAPPGVHTYSDDGRCLSHENCRDPNWTDTPTAVERPMHVVHTDCGTLLNNGHCPTCDMIPDMQSTHLASV